MDAARAACIAVGGACVGIQTDSDPYMYGAAPKSHLVLRTGSAMCVFTGASDWSTLKKECCVTHEAEGTTCSAHDQASGANPRPLSEQADASNGTTIDYSDTLDDYVEGPPVAATSAATGSAAVRWRYASEGPSPRPLLLSLNTGVVQTIDFPSTNSSSIYEYTAAATLAGTTLITIGVHARDVLNRLMTEKKVETAPSFSWQSQLKCRWDEDVKKCFSCFIIITDAKFAYSYEHSGNCGRLVITALTDRCYNTLTQAMRLLLGGAPVGPAGTGKAETTKDLGSGLAIWVIVLSCSDQINYSYKTMENVFSGLVQASAWGCFDEFKRIPVDVHSVSHCGPVLVDPRRHQGEEVGLSLRRGDHLAYAAAQRLDTLGCAPRAALLHMRRRCAVLSSVGAHAASRGAAGRQWRVAVPMDIGAPDAAVRNGEARHLAVCQCLCLCLGRRMRRRGPLGAI